MTTKIKPIPPGGIVLNTPALREAAAGEFRAIIDMLRAALHIKLYPGDTNRYVSIEAVYSDRVVVSADNGRLLAFPYTITDANMIELGVPEEVILHHTPVAAMRVAEAAGKEQGVFIEAQDATGLRWLIRVIKSGLSGNNNFYPDAVLREAVPLFAGARVFAKADDEHLAGKGKSVRNLIGRITEPVFIESKTGADSGEIRAVLELLESAGEIPAKLREAWDRGMAQSLFGFSIDANGTGKSANGIRTAKKITKVHSVDLIIEPGAGGQLINLIEAQATDNPEENSEMKLRDRMIETIKAAHQGTLPATLNIEDEAALEAAWREAVVANANATRGDAPAPGITRAELDEHTRLIEARADMRTRVAACGLPEIARNRVRQQLEAAETFTEAQVDAAIKAEREYLGKFTESGHVSGLGGSFSVETTESYSTKVEKMLDAFFDPADRSVISMKECYREITGDSRVSGRLDQCDQSRMREALGAGGGAFRESLDSGSFANVLGNSITRRLVMEYRAAADYDIWRLLTGNPVPVSDFRTNERTRFGGYGDLPTVAQGANYAALASPTDEAATYAVAKRGGTEDVTLEMIKNDDVGAITRIPVKLARTAKRTLAKFVLDFIRTNPVIYDGTALFTVGHGNLGAAALDATSLAARRLAMLKQAELNSADRLGIGPKYIWVAVDGQEAAVNLFNRNTNNDKTFINSMALMVVPVWYWTDANDWALSSDPMDVPTIELGFLDGNEEPELFVQDNPTVGSMFSNDKLTYKIRHIYGGNVIDFRGMDKSVVA